jgi:phospholipid/cholesterol/gamma-HCH transport system ATP-binding protein
MYLKVKNISKFFGQKKVLTNISFELKAGDSLAIIGESGCGKSTLIKIIAGLLSQTTGSANIYNSDAQEIEPSIGYAFQLNALFDSYTIWQNIAFKEYIEGTLPKKALIRKVYEVMKSVNLEPSVARLYPKDLSGGMQKRVAIARAIVNNPNLLFLDEPTSGLDPYTSSKIVETINAIHTPNGEKPIKLSIIHDMKVMKNMTNKVLFIKDGTINWFGEVSNIDNETSYNEALRKFISHI